MDLITTKAAEGVLTKAFGAHVRLEVGDVDGLSGRTHVHRALVTGGGSAAPTSVIVKQPRAQDDAPYDPTRPGGVASTFFGEWAGLELLTETDGEDPVAPRFYGGDRAAGVMVMEDLGTGARLDHALLADDEAAAERTLRALMGTLGRMHAQTVSHTARYIELRQALGPTADGEVVHQMRGSRARWLRDTFIQAEFTPARGFYAEMDALRARWNEVGSAHAYVHFDPCPDNCHWVGDQLRLLDMENGKLAPWAADGAYPRIHFPTCWCVNRLPEPTWRAAEEAYRLELARGWPPAEDDGPFAEQMVGACAFWAYDSAAHIIRRAWDEDQTWGISNVRQRVIMRFELLADTCDEFGLMPATGETARCLVARLQVQWPDTDAMPLYPAFRAAAPERQGHG